jgi:HAMP domain-containing protein
MSIRTKLVGAFLLVATMVPVVAVIVARVGGVDDGGGGRGDDDAAIAVLMDLAESQRAQQADVLMFLAGGTVDARQRYIDRSLPFQGTLSRLEGSLPDEESQATVEQIARQREQFGSSAEEILNARATIDRNLGELRAAQREIVQEINTIRGRYGGPGGDLAAIPAGQRAQVADLLRAVEGMLQAVDLQIALAIAYTLQQQETTRQQMDAAGATFAASLRLANASAGADDRAVLGRVEALFTGRLEPSAESLVDAADVAAQARAALAEASDGIIRNLNELTGPAAGATVAGGASGIDRTQAFVAVGTLLAFLLAGGLGLWFAGAITRPIRQLRAAAERVSTGELDAVDIDINTKDEVGDLANAFRRMVASIRFLMLDKAEREADDRDFMSTSISI